MVGCLHLTVKEPFFPPTIKLEALGFGEVSFTNEIFEAPCEVELADVQGYKEAIFVDYKCENVTEARDATFVVEYTRPSGQVVHWEWTTKLESKHNGTLYRVYRYDAVEKYKKGTYTGLIGSVSFDWVGN